MYEYYGLFNNKLLFTTYKEFTAKRSVIIEEYNHMTSKEILIYRMYVYSRPFISDKRKDLIWEIITGFDWMSS